MRCENECGGRRLTSRWPPHSTAFVLVEEDGGGLPGSSPRRFAKRSPTDFVYSGNPSFAGPPLAFRRDFAEKDLLGVLLVQVQRLDGLNVSIRWVKPVGDRLHR